MALKPIRARLRNHSNGLAKIYISIAAGDEIEVSGDVVAQIAHQGAPMSDATLTPEPVKAAKKVPAKKAAPKAKV